MITQYSILDTRNMRLVTRDSSMTSDKRRAPRHGFTLVELVVTMAAASIVMITAAVLVNSGYRSWNRTFNTANCESRLGVLDTMIALGAVGRKSNKTDYRVYEVVGNTFTRALPLVGSEEDVNGQAVEFRYWDPDVLTADLMDPSKTATAYALFYLDGDKLKVDYGLYPPGGINASGHRVTGAGVTTVTLAQNVTSVEFGHKTKNMAGDGWGCVRMKLVIADPTDSSSKTTMAATLMRNVWPPQ